MRLCHITLASIALAAVSVVRASAEDLSKDDEKWLAQVAPLILPSERERYEQLDKKDRDEFKKIFWARRDDDPELPKADNAFRETYHQRLEEADRGFRVLGRKGSETDCGVVLLLFGEPAERRKVGGSARGGARTPEDWVYRGDMFANGETTVSFDASCELPRDGGAEFRAQLDNVAEALVRRPALDYQLDDEGRLVKLEDRLPKPNRAAELLEEPRQDFVLETETKLMMRGQQGATYVAGMLRGDASELGVREEAGRRVVDLVIAVEAVATDGSVPQAGALELVGEVDEEDRFLASWPLTLPGGQYTARIAVFDPGSDKGAVTNLIFQAPDYGSGELGWSPLLLLAEMRQLAAAESDHAYAALTLGTNQLITRFGNVFAPSDQIQLLAFLYNAALDPATGKAALSTGFEIKNADGKLLSKSPEQVFDTEQSIAAVGPVPLSSFSPGEYTAELRLDDTVAGRKEVVRSEFTVVDPAAADADAPEGTDETSIRP